MSVTTNTILWRRLDEPGHESARLEQDQFEVRLGGSAVFVEDDQPCRLDYDLSLNTKWQTLLAYVKGWRGIETIDLTIWADEDGRWWINDVEYPSVQGCIDLDLSFSSVTNVIPLNRLTFAIGEEHEVVSAWLIFPELTLQPLQQRYRRLDDNRYHYWSDNGFETELTTNEAGFVIDYPPLWTEEK